MRKAALSIALFIISYNINAQFFMEKVPLKEGKNSHKVDDALNIVTLLQVYDEKSETHLTGNIYLRVDNNNDPIAEFYIDNNKSAKEYFTKVYGNYFLTFMTEEDNRYLIIEQAQFGKAFALSSNGSATIGNNDDLVEIEITDYFHEWGYDGPPEDDNRSYFEDVNYTLKMTTKDVVKSVSFYGSEVKGSLIVDLGNYNVLILSDMYKSSSSLLEMIINKKEKN